MDADLRARLQERLFHRAERLTKMAKTGAPVVVLSLMAEHVQATAMLLFGDEIAKRMFDRVMNSLRDGHGICVCGKSFLATGQPLCRACMQEMEDLDAELDAYDPAMFEEVTDGNQPATQSSGNNRGSAAKENHSRTPETK